MAKKQTFASKVEKAQRSGGDARIVVKIVESKKSEQGNWKFAERYVKVENIDKLDQALAES